MRRRRNASDRGKPLRARHGPLRMLSLRNAAPLLLAGVIGLSAAAYGYTPDVTEMRTPATRADAPTAPAWKPRVVRTKTVSMPRATMPTPTPTPTATNAGVEEAAANSALAPPAQPTVTKPLLPSGKLPAPADFLVRLFAAQDAFAADALVDEDHDRRGEYAGLAELIGAESGRMSARLPEAALDIGDARMARSGALVMDGYLFRVYLRGRFDDAVGEPRRGFGAGVCDPDLAERVWGCYAWPVTYGKTGTATYFVSDEGVVLVTDDPEYSGHYNGPAADAARLPFDPGSDGNAWRVLE